MVIPEPRKDIGFLSSGAGRRYGIIVQNNPVNFIDPDGYVLCLIQGSALEPICAEAEEELEVVGEQVAEAVGVARR